MRSILAILLLCSAFSRACAQAQVPSDAIARGKALTEAADCAGCHTADSAKPFAGGKRIESPFGAVYSPNLTPDRDTGIGGWSDDDFYRALHEGIAPSGSHYYPIFPYPNFTRMTRDDVLAIRAYLATLQPVHNTTSSPELRWPYSYRALMRAWDWLFFSPAPSLPIRTKARSGIAAPIWSGARRIAAPAIRRRTGSVRTAAATPMAARRSRAGSRHGSTARRAAA